MPSPSSTGAATPATRAARSSQPCADSASLARSPAARAARSSAWAATLALPPPGSSRAGAAAAATARQQRAHWQQQLAAALAAAAAAAAAELPGPTHNRGAAATTPAASSCSCSQPSYLRSLPTHALPAERAALLLAARRRLVRIIGLVRLTRDNHDGMPLPRRGGRERSPLLRRCSARSQLARVTLPLPAAAVAARQVPSAGRACLPTHPHLSLSRSTSSTSSPKHHAVGRRAARRRREHRQ